MYYLSSRKYSEAVISGTKPDPISQGGLLIGFNWDEMEHNMNNVQYEREGHSSNLIENSVYLFGGYYKG